MEQNRNYKGMKRYESLLKTICIVEEYHWEEEKGVEKKEWKEELVEAEWEGCLGVACVISVIEGVTPSLPSLAKHLDISSYDRNLQMAFERLKINGVFGNRLNIKKDSLLNGNGINSSWHDSAERERNAWCNISGIAGGFIGIIDEKK